MEAPSVAQPSSSSWRMRARTPAWVFRVLQRVAALRGDPEAAVLVCSSDSRGLLARAIKLFAPKARVRVVQCSAFESVHAELSAQRPLDLVVDECSTTKQVARFLGVFYQLKAGGEFLARHPRTELQQLLAQAREATDSPYPGKDRSAPGAVLNAHGLGRSMQSSGVLRGGALVVERNDYPVLAKLREEEMNPWLVASGPTRGQVLEVIPAEPFDSRCVFTENSETRRPGFPKRYQTIDLSLRLYQDMTFARAQVLTNDRIITPDSYRHNQYSRLRNRNLVEIAPRFASLRARDAEPTPMAGTFFHLDSEFRGHFGHLMTEQMARFWAWRKAVEFDPEVRAIVGVNKHKGLQPWESLLYAAGGIPPEKVVLVNEAVRLERVIAGTPMLSNPHYVHPGIIQTWAEVADNLLADAGQQSLPKRFFCSRRHDKRACVNTPEMESFFAAAGFEIIYPEDYSLGDQVRLFQGAEAIAGFAGSALFNLCFVMEPKPVIMVGSTAYTARNEYLIASLLGHQLTSLTCVPENPDSYQSPFIFNPDREGGFLRQALDRLS